MLLDVGTTNHSKSCDSPLTPQLCCSHVISFPGRTSMSTELGVGGEEGAALGPNATDYHGFYPKFSLWNIHTSQIVFSEFWGSWFVVFASFIVFSFFFLKICQMPPSALAMSLYQVVYYFLMWLAFSWLWSHWRAWVSSPTYPRAPSEPTLDLLLNPQCVASCLVHCRCPTNVCCTYDLKNGWQMVWSIWTQDVVSYRPGFGCQVQCFTL